MRPDPRRDKLAALLNCAALCADIKAGQLARAYLAAAYELESEIDTIEDETFLGVMR